MENLTNGMELVGNGSARIKVFGVGGGGGNAINHMIREGIKNVKFVEVNTDVQQLARSLADEKIQIGKELTRGLGAGAKPEVGRQAAEESREDIKRTLKDTDMVFIAAGMGGGSGTGAAPVIAEIAQEMKILTVGVVTMPFDFEGKTRMAQAIEGKNNLREKVDTLITIPNNKLREFLSKQNKKFVLTQAFKEVDNVLLSAVQGITDLILVPGLINLDFADITTVMKKRGPALMGIGVAEGEGGEGTERAQKATLMAMKNPLLDHDIRGAKGVIVNITGGPDFTFEDLDLASEIIHKTVDNEDATIIIGAVVREDESMVGKIQVTVVATGFEENSAIVQETKTASSLDLLKRGNEEEKSPATELESLAKVLEIPDFLRKWN